MEGNRFCGGTHHASCRLTQGMQPHETTADTADCCASSAMWTTRRTLIASANILAVRSRHRAGMASTGRRRKRGQRELYIALAAVLVLNLVCYRALNPLRSALSAANHDDAAAAAAATLPSLARRAYVGDHGPEDHGSDESEALIDWLQLYLSATPGFHRIAVFSLMLLWLVFLFAFVGICASEFFCPNLSHISSRLGLSESVVSPDLPTTRLGWLCNNRRFPAHSLRVLQAGVTFLAFSNGSPDVFSTFSALRSNSGSLAIGELLGAASFITSVVASVQTHVLPPIMHAC